MLPKPTYDITFVRHGESVGNAENRVQGQAEFPLSETGRAQALALAERWKNEGISFDFILSSPLSRAFETGQIIADVLNYPNPIEPEPLWLERNNGKRAGLTWDEIQIKFPDPEFYNPYQPIAETGEGDWALYLRAGQALHKILQRQPGRYLIISHGAILNMTFYAIMGLTPHPNSQGPRFHLRNTCFSRFIYHPHRHRWEVNVIGDRTHWKRS
jgi:probable phosphoglycerate mutase